MGGYDMKTHIVYGPDVGSSCYILEEGILAEVVEVSTDRELIELVYPDGTRYDYNRKKYNNKYLVTEYPKWIRIKRHESNNTEKFVLKDLHYYKATIRELEDGTIEELNSARKDSLRLGFDMDA